MSRQSLFAAATLSTAIICSGCTSQAQEVAPPIEQTIAPKTDASIVVSAQVAGRTPNVIGYNMGDNFPGSNVSSWLRYSGMNGARFWWPQTAWPSDSTAPDAAPDLAWFEAQREQLRAAPSDALDWKAFEANIARVYKGAPPGTLGACFPLSELHRLDARVLTVLARSPDKNPFDNAAGAPDWFGRWTYWRGVYINAFYLARQYDVERFQLFNEPDHSSNLGIEQSDFLRRLQLGSDAVQAAVHDVNRLTGKTLKAQVSAPVTAGMMIFEPRSGRADTRDAKTGWGQLVVAHRMDDFPGRSADNEGLFGVYAFQNYGRTSERITRDLPRLHELIRAANGGKELPIIASEMNVSTAADFSKKPETLDSPAYYDAFGAIASAYVNAGMDEMYVFRLTQTANLGEGRVKKNGTYLIDNDDPLKNITSSTRGAEAVRLFMRGFAGGRQRFEAATIAGDNLYSLAARDEKDDSRTLLISNVSEARSVGLDLSAWKIPAGVLATVEEVSETHHGDISQILALPAEGRVALSMAAHSVALLTIRPARSAKASAILPVSLKGGALNVEVFNSTEGAPVLLSMQAKATGAPLRLRIYGGEGNLAQSELLGQVTLSNRPAKVTVDASRYAATAGQKLFFRAVPDDARLNEKAFEISAAQVRVFGAGAR